jgi:RNA polymerase sigma-70 factor (ECF subfamily)
MEREAPMLEVRRVYARSTPADGRALEQRRIFEEEALPHLDALYTAALRLTRDETDARDLLQETILRAYRFFHLFTPGTNCRAWLLTILHNNFRNGWRRAAREPIATSPEEYERELESESFRTRGWETDPESIFTARMIGGEIGVALDALPEDFRSVLLLIDVHELNYNEAAQVMGVPIGTIKSRVSRGRAMMRYTLSRLARVHGIDAKRAKLRFSPRQSQTGEVGDRAR